MRKLKNGGPDGADATVGSDYGSVGTHVASVLEAAAAAAAQVSADAERDAAARISEASAEANRIVHEAEGLRAEAETTAQAIRERANDFAERRRKDAEDEAAIMLQNAETLASHQHGELIAREEALREAVELSERRLRHLVDGLRELTDTLEGVLGGTSLDEALKPSVRSG